MQSPASWKESPNNRNPPPHLNDDTSRTTLTPFHPDISQIIAPSRILVATNLRDLDLLVPHAVAQAQATRAHITLLHVIEQPESFASAAQAGEQQTHFQQVAEIERRMSAESRKIRDHGLRCTGTILHGDPSRAIRQMIFSTGASRLILGSPVAGYPRADSSAHRPAPAKLSPTPAIRPHPSAHVPPRLLDSAIIPIFTVDGASSGRPGSCAPQRILHPFHRHNFFRQQAALAVELARQHQARLTLLYVPAPGESSRLDPKDALALCDDLFAELVPEGARKGANIEISIGFGDLLEHIEAELDRSDPDWIVMGIESQLRFQPLEEGQVQRIVALAGRPVLAIPASRTWITGAKRSVTPMPERSPAPVLPFVRTRPSLPAG